MQAGLKAEGSPDPRSIETDPIPLTQLPYVLPDILDELSDLRAQVIFLAGRVEHLYWAIEHCPDIETLRKAVLTSPEKT